MVNRLIATRYMDGGRGPDHFDCWGLVVEVCRQMGWPIPVDPLLVATSLSQRRAGFAAHYDPGDWIMCDGPDEGAIGFTPLIDRASHAGICIGGVFLETGRRAGPQWTEYYKLRVERWEWARWAKSC